MTSSRSLQQFTLLRRLATGGMGELFLGRDQRTGRLAAIKTLSERLSGKEIYVRRFQREARLYRKLTHPNIVGCLESGFEDGVYYIAMEYIEGRSLARILEVYGALSVEQSLCVLAQLADALEFAHRQYVIHRDIKPRNIMITTEGVVKLVDFGVAHVVDDQLIQTDVGQMVGTYRYASPEQLLGGKVTVQSDLYCLGLVLYEMLCGERALRDLSSTDFDPASACREIVPLQNRSSEIPGHVITVVNELLAFNPEERPASAARVTRDVDEAVNDPAVLKPLVSVFGDVAQSDAPTLGTLATTVTTFLRRSLFTMSLRRRIVLVGAVALWIILSFVFYFILGSQGMR